LELTALVDRLHHILQWVDSQTTVANHSTLVGAIESNLEAARGQLGRRQSGSRLAVVLAHLDAAQTDLLRLAPPSYVLGALPSLVVAARKVFSPEDPRLVRLENLAKSARSDDLTEDDRQSIVASASAVNEEERRNRLRLENFRSVVLATTIVLVILAVAAGWLGLLRPEIFPVCFYNDSSGSLQVACPTEYSDVFGDEVSPISPEQIRELTTSPVDVVFLEFVGILGAALSSAIAIKNLRGSADPYSISMALTLLKLATGALIAVFGIVLIRAGLVPGVDSLDTSPEIIAWALVLGYAQQLFTGVIDRRAESVLRQSGAWVNKPGS
jgi:hypothetical protein